MENYSIFEERKFTKFDLGGVDYEENKNVSTFKSNFGGKEYNLVGSKILYYEKNLIISQGYWPEVFPINTIVNQLSKSNFKIDVLTGYPNYPKGYFIKVLIRIKFQ